MSAVDTITMMARDYVDDNSKRYIDNTFQAAQLARSMRESARNLGGGPAVVEYFIYAGAGGGAHLPGKRFNNRKRPVGQQLRWVPKLQRVPVVVDLTDLRVYNAPSPYKILDLLESQFSIAYPTIGAYMEIGSFLPGTGVWAANVNGFAEICDANDVSNPSFDGNNYSVYGEIDRTDANWGKKVKGNCLQLATEIGYDTMEKTYTKVVIGGAEPKIGYFTPLGESSIRMKFQAQQRFNEVTEPTLGYMGMRFRRAIIMSSRYVPGSEVLTDDIATDYVVYSTEDSSTPQLAYPTVTGETGWWLNTEDAYLHYYLSRDRIFGMGVQDFIPSAEHDGLVSAVRLSHILACPGPRYQYEITQITVL